MTIERFGERLYNVRKAKDMSQEEVANLMETTKQVISRYERGERTPKITVAAKCAEVLGVNLSYLLGDDVPMYKESADSNANGLTKEALNIIQMWQDIPEESQKMAYLMIEAALKSRGL